MPGAAVKDQQGVSSRWSIWLWRAFWLVWALRGISLLIDLGAAESWIEVVSWIAFGAVLIELSVRQVRPRNRR